jgi:dienelactone hydrolase
MNARRGCSLLVCQRMASLPEQTVLVIIMSLLSSAEVVAKEPANYDESKLPAYSLPDPLVLENGRPVTDAQSWFEQRRPEILQLFRSEVYGHWPPPPDKMDFELTAKDTTALAGRATRKKVKITVHRGGASHSFDVVIFSPNRGPRPVPVFVGILLFDKQAEAAVPGQPLEDVLNQGKAIPTEQPLPGANLMQAILDRGYAVASIDAEELAPDSPEHYRKGVIGLFSGRDEASRTADQWGAIGAWAWGLSRAMDYLLTDREFDGKRVAVIGHSRRGKTALWAGAQDPRFSMMISNNSGCGGAALSRRRFGETVKAINDRFPHWFCLNFRKYNDAEDRLPVDQHQLIALAAPRPVYVASAEDDGWADPRGEFLSCLHADPVYELLSVPGLGMKEPPALNESAGQGIGYHIRAGKHALTDFDWLKYLDFADRHWRQQVQPPSADL